MNRAATSLMRVAPRVITTNWITTRIENRITPTITWSPATNSPNARITPPAASSPSSPPRVSTSRVVATLSTSRVSVVVSRIVGNALNSCGARIESVVRSTSTATREVGREQDVEQPGGDRHHEDEDRADDGDRQDQAPQAAPDRIRPGSSSWEASLPSTRPKEMCPARPGRRTEPISVGPVRRTIEEPKSGAASMPYAHPGAPPRRAVHFFIETGTANPV